MIKRYTNVRIPYFTLLYYFTCETRQSWTSRFAPRPPFAAIVYDDKIKQCGSPGEYVGKFDYLLQHAAHVLLPTLRAIM